MPDSPEGAEPFVRVEGVGVAYGSRMALQPTDLSVAAGSIVARR